MHFFSPAHIMKLVEVVRSPDSSQETINTVEQFTQELRKIPVIVKECPGFLVNRLLMAYLNEAVLALEEGLARLDNLPLSLRLVRQLHSRLMQGVRGSERAGGSFRRHQNYIAPAGAPITEATSVS